MSANALIVSVLVVLVLVAAAARVVIGPIAGVAGKDGLYAVAKIGAVSEPMAARIEMARSDVRRGE